MRLNYLPYFLLGFDSLKLHIANVTTFLFLSLSTLISPSASATFSIIACGETSKTCVAAVATNNLAVGASVIYAEGDVGAVATQFETNPRYGPQGLKLLQQGMAPEKVMQKLLENDNNFDGGTVEDRQVALISVDGLSAEHTGLHAAASVWSGSITGELEGTHYAVQGNGLVGDHVLLSMQKAFTVSSGTLAERAMLALAAGQAAGGQKTGHMSAALLSRTLAGFPHDIDIRVDASAAPVQDLQRLLDFHYARQLIIGAERMARLKKFDQSLSLNTRALERGAGWDRIWRRAARLAIKLNDIDRAIEYLGVFYALNPKWFNIEIQQPLYQPLRNNPQFMGIGKQ